MKCPADRLILQQEKIEEMSKGGIIIPDKVREKTAPGRGIVVCAGPDCKFTVVGDKVIFDKDMALKDNIPCNTAPDSAYETYVFLSEKNVLAIV